MAIELNEFFEMLMDAALMDADRKNCKNLPKIDIYMIEEV